MLFLLYYIVAAVFVVKFFILVTKSYCKSNVCLIGKTAIITGGNGGMGKLIALNLASRGCRVILGDVVDAKETVKNIVEATNNSDVTYIHVDLANLASVRKFAAQILENEKHIDILINNAGCGGFCTNSDDGIYKLMQINYLGHFLLTHLLTPRLKDTPKSRVVFVSSLLAFTHDLLDGTDINRQAKISIDLFKPIFDYGNTKVAMIAATKLFARKLKQHDVTVVSVHPGLVDTNIFDFAYSQIGKNSIGKIVSNIFIKINLLLFSKTPFEGIQCTLHAALSDHVKSGSFLVECKNFWKPSKVQDEAFCANLWKESVRLVKLSKEEEI